MRSFADPYLCGLLSTLSAALLAGSFLLPRATWGNVQQACATIAPALVWLLALVGYAVLHCLLLYHQSPRCLRYGQLAAMSLWSVIVYVLLFSDALADAPLYIVMLVASALSFWRLPI